MMIFHGYVGFLEGRCGHIFVEHLFEKTLGKSLTHGSFSPHLVYVFPRNSLLWKIGMSGLVGNIIELNGQFPIALNLPESNVSM